MTLGVALVEAGVDARVAFPLGDAGRSRLGRGDRRARRRPRCRDSALVCFFDEPALVRWRGATGPLDREVATDLLSTALAAPACLGRARVRRAATCASRSTPARRSCTSTSARSISTTPPRSSRFLDGGGWVAWGAIPTHRPVGEQPQPLWKALLDAWCELTRRGCDPVRLRAQALVAPACGLAGHGASQAERAMLLAREIGNRVHDHAAATKLAVGA